MMMNEVGCTMCGHEMISALLGQRMMMMVMMKPLRPKSLLFC